MKYLKLFESIEDQDHINTIKDVFQDIFDEWNMEESNSNPGAGLYWSIYKDGLRYCLYIRKYDGEGYRIDMPPIDISGHMKTLSSMGYRTEGEKGEGERSYSRHILYFIYPEK